MRTNQQGHRPTTARPAAWPAAGLIAAAAITLAAGGCGDEEAPPSAEANNAENNATGNNAENNAGNNAENNTATSALTYNRDIAPLMDAHCTSCHIEGGAAPFSLDTYTALKAYAPIALNAMDSGRMPPWPPDRNCRTFRDERFMPAEGLATFRAWMDGGMAEGDPADRPAAPVPPTFEPTHTGMIPSGYLPGGESPDDYRCFILDAEFERDMYLTGSVVVPDARALVHHVLVYAIPPDQLDRVLTADAEEEGEGYTCFGGPFPSRGARPSDTDMLTSLPTQLGAWVPGAAPSLMDEGVGIRIAAGSRVVMQIHYNTLTTDPVPDQTAFQMRLTEQAPTMLATTRPLLIHALEIPAGEAEAINEATFTNHTRRELTIASVTAHMHLLGTSWRATIQRAGGGEECLLDIPDWDFNWQQSYRFPEGEHITLAPDDSITLRCVYDNSPGHQPVVNGQQQEPRDVTWGEGTLDEMCMLYMTFLNPYTPPEDASAGCGVVTECLDACEAAGTSTSACVFACEAPTACKVCALQSIVPCAATSCLAPFSALQGEPCFETCLINTTILGGDTAACLDRLCPEAFGDVTACLDPILDAGSCDARLMNSCGIEL